MVFQAQSQQRCRKETDNISVVWRCDWRSWSHPLGAKFAPSRHKACNLRSALHQTRKQRIYISKRRLLRKSVQAVWHSACLLCLPLVCAWCPLYEFCSFPMRQTRPQSMYKGHPLHNATPRLPFFLVFFWCFHGDKFFLFFSGNSREINSVIIFLPVMFVKGRGYWRLSDDLSKPHWRPPPKHCYTFLRENALTNANLKFVDGFSTQRLRGKMFFFWMVSWIISEIFRQNLWKPTARFYIAIHCFFVAQDCVNDACLVNGFSTAAFLGRNALHKA